MLSIGFIFLCFIKLYIVGYDVLNQWAVSDRRGSFSEGRFKRRRKKSVCGISSLEGVGPSIALYWLAVEYKKIQSAAIKVNKTEVHVRPRNVKLKEKSSIFKLAFKCVLGRMIKKGQLL